MMNKRSGPSSRGGFKGGSGGGSKGGSGSGFNKGGFNRGGSSRGDSSRGDSSRGGFSRGDSSRGDSFRGDKPRGGGGGFGGRGASSSRGHDSGNRNFSDRPQGGGFSDRPPRRDFDDRAPRNNSNDRSAPRRDRDMPFEDRPRRSFKQEGFGASRRRDDSDTQRPRDRSFGDSSSRPPRRDFGDRPQPRRDFGDRPPRRDFGDRPQQRRDFDDRPPRRDFGDRPQRREGGFEARKFENRQGFDKRPAHHSDETQEFAKPAMKGHELVIYGVHAVQAALRNPKRTVTTIWVTDIGEAHLKDAFDATRHPEAVTLTRRAIEQKLPDGAVHQGIAIAVEPLEDMFLSDVLAAANAPAADRQVVVVLDEVTDPHNVGAIMRSMSMFGASALIVHKRNAPSITGVMAKIATGAVEHVPMIPVTNLAKAIEELQLAGFYCLGLDEDASISLGEVPKEGHIALVLGAEGEGLREKTRTTCNAIASIASFGKIKSLNVSNAAAIALFSITGK